MRHINVFLIIALVTGLAFALDRSPSPDGAHVYINSPTNDDRLSSPVTVKFGLRGMGVAPAGVERPNTGHHHLIIDGPLPALDLPIPATATSIHFGGGQTETTVELEPGKHTLQLLLGDYLHIPHEPPVYSEVVTVYVE